jgi:hypothetical protein
VTTTFSGFINECLLGFFSVLPGCGLRRPLQWGILPLLPFYAKFYAKGVPMRAFSLE